MKKKRMLSILTVMLFALLLTGCSSGPGSVVKSFFEALEAGELEEALGYMSAASVQALGRDKWKAGLAEMSAQLTTMGGIKSLTIDDEVVNGELATVTFTLEVEGDAPESDSIDLIEEDGDWKIKIDPYANK